MVHAGSSSIAEAFGMKRYMGWFLFFMRGAGVASRIIHGAKCVNITHMNRVILCTVLGIFSFAGISLASANTDILAFFYVSIFCSIFMGVS